MSKQNKNPKINHLEKKEKSIKEKKDLLERLDHFFQSKSTILLWISIVASLILSFLLFNVRVSEGGDDSAYILRAFEFIKEMKFPSFQGPLYPLVLSFFVWIFGINVFVLKFLSIIFILIHLYFFYKAFNNRIPSFISTCTLLIIALNAALLYYASQTYNEAFFLMLQALFFYFFFRYILDQNENVSIKNYIILGLLVFLIGITKTIGFSVLIVVLIFLLAYKNWKGAFITLVSFIGFYLILEIIKRSFFGEQAAQFNSQLGTLLQVDPYDASKGLENFKGYINRFWGNSNLYLSKHLYNFLGLKSNIVKTSAFITVSTYVLFLVSFIVTIRKNKYLAFTGIYLITMCGATFITLQTRWDQERLILVYLPLILIFIFSGLYFLAKQKMLKTLQIVLPLLILIIFLTNLKVTLKKVKENDDLLMNSLSGNKFYGMTPDWINYIKMSEWAAENIPDSVNIACRKPSISFIYGKRNFYGVYRIPSTDPDTLLNILKTNKVHYFIMGSLRRNPKQKTEHTINTEQRYLYYLSQKYPEKIKLVHTIGVDESAFLFEIKY